MPLEKQECKIKFKIKPKFIRSLVEILFSSIQYNMS